MKLVAVYGSLKKGFYNHAGLGHDAEFLGTSTVRGVMYSNGSYPKLYETNGSLVDKGGATPFQSRLERQHEIEVYRIHEDRYESITNMEIGAGYEPEQIQTPYGEATIYYMPHENFHEGDKWVEAYTK